LENWNGVRWNEAPKPFFIHRCKAQTRGWSGLTEILRCRFIPQDDLRAGRWRAHVDALLAQAPPPERARIDGADVAAELILKRPT
jgi:hypothetical protein